MNKIKNFLLATTNPTWGALFLCGLNLIFMHYVLFQTCHLDAALDFAFFVDNFVGVCFDVLLVFFVVYWVSLKKSKVALSICFVVTWLWSLSSVMYSRFFYHYLSLSAVWQGGALADDLIVQCIKANVHLIDLFYPCAAVLFAIIIKKNQFDTSSYFWKRVFIGFFLIIVIDMGAHAIHCLSNSKLRYMSYYTHRLYSNHFVEHLNYSAPILAHFLRGEVRTLGAELLMDMRGNIELSERQMADIQRLAAKGKESLLNIENPNFKSNVIFILVESYMSFTSDLIVDGKEITPFLNSLKRDPSVYYNGKMNTNVTIGGSSDGQFIYMTGLLPLRSVLTLSKARHTTFLGLPQLLDRRSRMIIPTVTSIWDQDQMCRQYGFNELFAREDYIKDIDRNLTDEEVFQLAIQKDKDSREYPFFSIILTISMHQPYVEQIDSSFPIKDSSITDELANYLNACHYTDVQIEKYFVWLKESGLYDNSLIVIAADHPVDNTDFGGVIKDIPLYIVNSGVLPSNMWQGKCNQLDVYTTILNLLGCKSDWYGLGHSLVSPKYDNLVSSQTWDVSEWIILGDYFSKSQ